jgi:phage gpG-like protein
VITIQMVGNRELAARLDAMPGRLHDGLARAVVRLGLALQKKIQDEKLSGQVLKVRTGSLRSSINTEVTNTATRIEASVGANVKYAAVHEYGVDHPWTIWAKGRALRFELGGRVLFRKSVRHPPLPERSFLRSALADMAPAIDAGLREAVEQALR